MGLHKSANESLVSAWGGMYLLLHGCTLERRYSKAVSLITVEIEDQLACKLVTFVMIQQMCTWQHKVIAYKLEFRYSRHATSDP